MPRAPRRGPLPTDEQPTTTPTRPGHNAITATIPPFMLDTPPHAPFLTTQQPAHNPNESIVPEQNNASRRPRNQATPAPNGDLAEGSQASTHALSAPSEVGEPAEQSYLSSIHQEAEDAKELLGLRDISSLATWTLSSAKPGCALPQLRSPDTNHFWQSDGPQPHTLTLHFFKLVGIVKMRVYLDFELDESYTPTKMKFYAGMSEGALVEFGEWVMTEETDPVTGEVRSMVESVKGWIDVDLTGVGGREKRYYDTAEDDEAMGEWDAAKSGDVLKAMVVQVRICENHQNGKDTHVRGFQVFARDETVLREHKVPLRRKGKKRLDAMEGSAAVGIQLADWMGDPEIR
ncbi:uncharacterized protein HMPREF1541_10965 [Cyphellophora europaea CBS 101466]|uniref:DOC domain-containing protein n=1 Tax=Cyphellophora europaea (strain CBS 101466) TaxID=1220924 RepID=W2S7D2_CYPE1|nr:uncharacterized protein HMPREF1541_10965 [Cyphellophora europaea CBS 101466]ETN43834.1 hypothetical protein HMPREF1541_10965 [Cyphellophora europaea CBS 101466]